jgi:hypothetical protein
MDKTMKVHAEWHDIRIRHIRVRTRIRSDIKIKFYSFDFIVFFGNLKLKDNTVVLSFSELNFK